MKTEIVSVKTKEPNTYEINTYGLRGWKLAQVKDIHDKGTYMYTEYHYQKRLKWLESFCQKSDKFKNKVLNFFGLRFELWKVVEGYRLAVDTKSTRYIFKPFWYVSKCNIKDLV